MVEIAAVNGHILYVNPRHVLIVKDSDTGTGSEIVMDHSAKGDSLKIHCKDPAKIVQERISTGLVET